MRVLAEVSFLAVTLSEVRTSRAGIVELPRITPASFLAWMRVRTLRPVVGPAACAPAHFKLEHSKVVGGKSVEREISLSTRNIGVGVYVVRRDVLLESC